MAKQDDQCNAYLTQIMELLQCYEDVINIEQAGYKDDFFEIFEDAFRSGFCMPSYRFDKSTGGYVQCKSQRPLVSRDAIWSFAMKRGWVHSEMDGSEKRYQDICLVRTWWNEWTYAWVRNRPKRKYKRKA